MLAGVGQQVGDHLGQLTAVAVHGHRLVRDVAGEHVVRPGGRRVHHRLDRELAQVQVDEGGRTSLVEPRQHQQILHQPGHPISL
ncbi:hypothetical protein SDC9_97199 [bioreactor metagenome]|uniref:Uncharacterized protein n=1 Tax=bioreactor metagenome TaxID=1076179 RepID=A0A645AB60_9ZZZZ